MASLFLVTLLVSSPSVSRIIALRLRSGVCANTSLVLAQTASQMLDQQRGSSSTDLSSDSQSGLFGVTSTFKLFIAFRIRSLSLVNSCSNFAFPLKLL